MKEKNVQVIFEHRKSTLYEQNNTITNNRGRGLDRNQKSKGFLNEIESIYKNLYNKNNETID